MEASQGLEVCSSIPSHMTKIGDKHVHGKTY